MFKRVLILFIVINILNIGTILAQPSLKGSTGLIEVPTADIIKNNNASFGMFHYDDYYLKSIGFGIDSNIEITIE